MIVTVDSGCIFSKCSISSVFCVYRKLAYCIKYTYCKTSMSSTVVHHCEHTRWASICMYLGRNLSWGMEASCCWFSPQNRINIQNKNQKLLFEHAGPQGEHCHVLFLTQWHLHTLLPNAIHLPDISSSRFIILPITFAYPCFQISHSFLAIRPFPFSSQ